MAKYVRNLLKAYRLYVNNCSVSRDLHVARFSLGFQRSHHVLAVFLYIPEALIYRFAIKPDVPITQGFHFVLSNSDMLEMLRVEDTAIVNGYA